MIPSKSVTQETMENIDPSDTIIPTDTIKTINETALERLINSRDTNREAQADSGAARAIVMTAHAHQVVFASEIDVRDGETNIHEQTHPYATCHVLDVTFHNTHLQIENVLHHLNKSRRTR